MINRCIRILLSALILACMVCFNVACSTTHANSTNSANDPLETYNRTVFGFNTAIDKVIVRPITIAYAFIVPSPIEDSIGNFFSNLGQIPTIANDVLQADPRYTVRDTWRFAINSTLGVLGLFDVASKMGLKRHSQDFGLTLAKWGIQDSPYFVLPIFGPSTLRDAIGIPVDYYALSVWPYIRPPHTRYDLYALQTLHQRKILLVTDKLVKEAFDPYIFVRSAYLQKRNYLMHGEKQPEETSTEDQPTETNTHPPKASNKDK